jgi:hypothetical protein
MNKKSEMTMTSSANTTQSTTSQSCVSLEWLLHPIAHPQTRENAKAFIHFSLLLSLSAGNFSRRLCFVVIKHPPPSFCAFPVVSRSGR